MSLLTTVSERIKMNKLFFISLFFLCPILVFGQTTMNGNSTLSQIATRNSISKQELLSSITGKVSGNIQMTDGFAAGSGMFTSEDGTFVSFVSGIAHPSNTAVIEQVGNYNQVNVNQFGNANLAVIQQAGNRIMSLVNQFGSGNVYGSRLTGDNHYLDVSQIGSNNLYLLEYSGDKTLNHTVQQIGNNLQAIQVGSISKPFSIKEQGSGMKILIQHNQY